MKTKAKLLCASLLLPLIIILPVAVRAESTVPLCEKTMKLLEQIQDLESLQRNMEECCQAEKRTLSAAGRSGQCWGNYPEFDGKLMNRVSGHLVGTPEYQRFMKAYRILIKRRDFGRLHMDELFAEYMILLESGRTRFRTQLKEWLKHSAESSPAHGHDRPARSIQVKTFTFGPEKSAQRNQHVRVVPAVRLQVQMPLNGSTLWAGGWKGVSRIVVQEMDQSGSTRTAGPVFGRVELTVPGARERLVPPADALPFWLGQGESVWINTNPQSRVEKGIGAWD
ncbi:MAG: hypothetical protein V1792_11705 [Pseudomonadota bacterium]